MYVGEFSFDKFVRPQSTAQWTRNSTTDTFLKVLRRNKCYKILKISKRSLCQTIAFFNVASLQFRILPLTKSDSTMFLVTVL